MTLEDLANQVSKQFFLTKSESEKIVHVILAEMTKVLKKGDRIALREFGYFKKTRRKKKRVRHPGTGELMEIPSRIDVDFSPSQQLLDTLDPAAAKRRKEKQKKPKSKKRRRTSFF